MNTAFWKSAGVRALHTVAQTALATISSTAALTGVNWWLVLDASILAGVISGLKSVVVGTPETPGSGIV